MKVWCEMRDCEKKHKWRTCCVVKPVCSRVVPKKVEDAVIFVWLHGTSWPEVHCYFMKNPSPGSFALRAQAGGGARPTYAPPSPHKGERGQCCRVGWMSEGRESPFVASPSWLGQPGRVAPFRAIHGAQRYAPGASFDSLPDHFVAREGIEPPTRGFSVLCSTD